VGAPEPLTTAVPAPYASTGSAASEAIENSSRSPETTIFVSTAPSESRSSRDWAAKTDRSPESIRIVLPDVGGAFGSKGAVGPEVVAVAAAAAAFAARAGIRAFVMVPKGSVALGKLSQAAIHGARVLTVEGNFDQALAIVRQIAERHPVTLVNSVNPFRLEGQKTGAFEVCDQLGRAPDYHLIPVGNAGNITAYWRGYREYHRAGRVTELPRMVGFQAAGAAPIYENRVVEEPRTVATAIKIGNPASWGPALEAVNDSRGWVDIVTDEEILRAYRMLAREEGIFMEPASAATVAGLIKSVKAGRFEPGSTLVLTLTGHGLKDPETALESASRPTAVPPQVDAVLAQLGL